MILLSMTVGALNKFDLVLFTQWLANRKKSTKEKYVCLCLPIYYRISNFVARYIC